MEAVLDLDLERVEPARLVPLELPDLLVVLEVFDPLREDPLDLREDPLDLREDPLDLREDPVDLRGLPTALLDPLDLLDPVDLLDLLDLERLEPDVLLLLEPELPLLGPGFFEVDLLEPDLLEPLVLPLDLDLLRFPDVFVSSSFSSPISIPSCSSSPQFDVITILY